MYSKFFYGYFLDNRLAQNWHIDAHFKLINGPIVLVTHLKKCQRKFD